MINKLLGYIVESLVFGFKAYAVAFVYVLASFVACVGSMVRFVFAPFAFDETFDLRRGFSQLGMIEFYMYKFSYSILTWVKKSIESTNNNPNSSSQ